MVACQNRQGLQGTVLDHQGSRPEEGSLYHMDLGHQDRRVDNRPVGTVLVGSSTALVAGLAGSVMRPDAE
jgi:hypothetical protein